MKLAEIPAPPAHLSGRGRELWSDVAAAYHLEAAQLALLDAACVALERLDSARETLDREGLVAEGSKGQVRPHPAVAIEAASRAAMVRTLRALGLTEAPESAGRIRGGRRHRTPA